MTHSFFKVLSLSLLIAFFTTSCLTDNPVEIGDIEGLKINKLSKKSVDLELMIPIINNNNYKFKIVDVDLHVSIDGVAVGKVEKLDKIIVNANSSDTHSLVAKLEFGSVLKSGLTLFMSFMKSNVKVKVKGNVKARAFLLSKTVEEDVKLFKSK